MGRQIYNHNSIAFHLQITDPQNADRRGGSVLCSTRACCVIRVRHPRRKSANGLMFYEHLVVWAHSGSRLFSLWHNPEQYLVRGSSGCGPFDHSIDERSVYHSPVTAALDDKRHSMGLFLYWWPFVRGIHSTPMDSPHKWSVIRSSHISIFVSMNKLWCTNSRVAGDRVQNQTHGGHVITRSFLIFCNYPQHTAHGLFLVNAKSHLHSTLAL